MTTACGNAAGSYEFTAGFVASRPRYMIEIGAYEAKAHLARLLDEVEAGASITITRNGRAVARLMPVPDAKAAADRIMALRAEVSKGRLSMRALIEEGRR